MEEAAFLMAVQRIIGGVEVEDDLLGRRRVRFEEEVDEQTFDRRPVVADLVVARRSPRGVLEPVQRAFASQRGAGLAPGGELARERRQHRVVAQLVVIDQILVAGAMPNTRCATIAATLCSTCAWARASSKQPANRSTGPIARSVAPSSNAPASDVTSPPSKAATTRRPSPTS
jgi:hypothetical protein